MGGGKEYVSEQRTKLLASMGRICETADKWAPFYVQHSSWSGVRGKLAQQLRAEHGPGGGGGFGEGVGGTEQALCSLLGCLLLPGVNALPRKDVDWMSVMHVWASELVENTDSVNSEVLY